MNEWKPGDPLPGVESQGSWSNQPIVQIKDFANDVNTEVSGYRNTQDSAEDRPWSWL